MYNNDNCQKQMSAGTITDKPACASWKDTDDSVG